VAKKGKMLEGAPRKSRLTKPRKEKKPGAGRNRGSLLLLLVLAVLVLGGMGIFTWRQAASLDAGLLAQREQLRRRADWVSLEELPPHLLDAFAAVVDTTSWRVRITGRRVDEDRPALSRDLVRQVHLLGGSVGGEARELVLAPLLEERLSRRGLLELYLNRISLGKTGDWQVYGVFHAAREYFGKDPRRLTLGEAATLAGILLPPRLGDPEAQPGAVGARRNEVLRLMHAGGKIDVGAMRQAAAEPLAFQPGADYPPMTRPLDWKEEPAVIRLPPNLRPQPSPDSAGAQGAPDAAP
jgi:membrane peptidoglycan carboxypeptidase